MPRAAIVANKLSKWFGEGEARTYAVKEASFEACWGEMLYIVGPSGSGKTTLLSMLSGILRPNSGSVEVDGSDLWSLSDDEIANFRLNTIGFVFQDSPVPAPDDRGERGDTDDLAEAKLEGSAGCSRPMSRSCGPGRQGRTSAEQTEWRRAAACRNCSRDCPSAADPGLR